MSETAPTSSAWQALQHPVFRMLWLASLASNIGTWMHEVGASWLMISLTDKPIWVALVQAMTTASISLFALPAGALADIIDRRRYLIVLQSTMLISALLLAVVTFSGKMTPELLLFLTFCLGAGAALSMPTWQALIPEMVPSKDLYSAILLFGVSMNTSRAIGPAMAGFIIAGLGPGAVFALNAASFFGIIFALKRWHREPIESTLPAERFFSAMRAGMRYVRGTPNLLNVMQKASAFFIFASASWALIPVVARTTLKAGPTGYGLLLASLGLGAVISAFILPRLRQLINTDHLVLLGGIAFSFTNLILAFSGDFYLSCFAMLLGGFAWIAVISTLHTIAQQSVSSWVRARALSIYLMIIFTGMAAGSILWGWIATQYSTSFALFISGIGLLIGQLVTYHVRLEGIRLPDHTPSKDSPAPTGEVIPSHEQGPIMITVEYTVDRENQDAFIEMVQKLRRIRLREGAYFWSLFQDIADHKKFVECFMVESWLEHLRYHERVSISDRRIQAKVNAFQNDRKKTKVTHLVACSLKSKQTTKKP